MKRFLTGITVFVTVHKSQIVALALALVATALLVARPVGATSFSIDTSGLLDNAATIFNGLWPAFAIVLGIIFGIGLLKFIAATIRSVFGG